MKCEKPITENMKLRVNTLYRYMCANREPITKEMVCEICGVKNDKQSHVINYLIIFDHAEVIELCFPSTGSKKYCRFLRNPVT